MIWPAFLLGTTERWYSEVTHKLLCLNKQWLTEPNAPNQSSFYYSDKINWPQKPSQWISTFHRVKVTITVFKASTGAKITPGGRVDRQPSGQKGGQEDRRGEEALDVFTISDSDSLWTLPEVVLTFTFRENSQRAPDLAQKSSSQTGNSSDQSETQC